MTEKNFEDLIKKTTDGVKLMVRKEFLGITAIKPSEGKWRVDVEVLERKAIPDTQNLIGVYEFTFDKNHELLEYKRVQVRRKGDVSGRQSAEESKE